MTTPYRERITPEPHQPLTEEEAEEKVMSAITTNGAVVDQIRNGSFTGTIQQGLVYQVSYVEALVIASMLRMKRMEQKLDHIEAILLGRTSR